MLSNITTIMKDGVEYLTKDKFEALQVELDTLRSSKRKEVAEQLEYARSLGDLSENAEYQEAREAQARLESRISQIKEILKHAEIVSEKSKKNSDTVDVGSTVVLQKGKGKDESTYHIVSPEEADITEQKISYQSPLGAALIDKKIGEKFHFETPKGKVEYTVVKIS